MTQRTYQVEINYCESVMEGMELLCGPASGYPSGSHILKRWEIISARLAIARKGLRESMQTN